MSGSTIIPDSERFTLSTSATWSAIERLRWTIPMPPSRASAIAIRASVTVSIAAETIGSSSAIVRVSRVAVETSFGSTADSAGHEQHVVEGDALLRELLGTGELGRDPYLSTSIWKL